MGLADLIHRQAKQREASEVDAIVGGRNNTSNARGRGKFGSACAEAKRSTAAAELGRARRVLTDNPKIIDGGPGAEGDFYSRFPEANLNELRELVEKTKRILHPPPSFADVPEAEPGPFVTHKR